MHAWPVSQVLLDHVDDQRSKEALINGTWYTVAKPLCHA